MEYIDTLKHVLRGEEYCVNQYISIRNPTVREVIDFGEDIFDIVLKLFTRKPYDIAVELWDRGIDYSTITDWDLFFDTVPNIAPEFSGIFFEGFEFNRLAPCVNELNGLNVLANVENPDIYIDEVIFRKMVTYLRFVYFISEKIEYDMGNEVGKQFLIKRMRRKQEKYAKDVARGKIRPQSRIHSMIMFCVNNPGCPYNYETIQDIPLVLLYETFHFLKHDNERNNLTLGIYAGRIDPSGMKDKSSLEIIPDLHKT